jgi:hypothetical protein
MGSRITAVYIDFDRKKVDKANRKLIDLINKRAAGDEHNTDGQNSDAI